MLKIVEIHISEGVSGEYIVLQNQGLVTVTLRGWAVVTEAYLESEDVSGREIAEKLYVFRMAEEIKPYTHVVLFTGSGKDGWVPTNDGRLAYCAYWGKSACVWNDAKNIHILQLSQTKPIAKTP